MEHFHKTNIEYNYRSVKPFNHRLVTTNDIEIKSDKMTLGFKLYITWITEFVHMIAAEYDSQN
jgi:hypothetical protein